MNLSWREVYRAALLEVQIRNNCGSELTTRKRQFIERSQELRQAGNQFNEEQAAMADALRTLRVLAQSECQADHLRLAEGELDKGRRDVMKLLVFEHHAFQNHGIENQKLPQLEGFVSG